MFDIVDEFERQIADFFGAPYAVSTDCCTHAIELCLRYKNVTQVTVPKQTYLSVPMTAKKIGATVSWIDNRWEEYYNLHSNIYDAAVLWRRNSYVKDSYMCLSFQYRKHLSLGRGGAILLSNKKERDDLIKLGYDGRHRDAPWAEQDINSAGYHYYMTPETAQLGLDKLPDAITSTPKFWTYKDYPNIYNLIHNVI
jgi:dTDP-4-amino-4,6-dideoxygalactose transaminase